MTYSKFTMCALFAGTVVLMNAAFGSSSERIFVGNRKNFYNGTVSVVDGASNAIIATVPSLGDDPYGIAANPAGTRIYVVNSNSNDVTVFDASSNAAVATFAVGQGPVWALASPDGARLYVTNYTDQNVSVIDTADYSLKASISVPQAPFALALNPSGSRLYVASHPYVYVIDTATNTEITQIDVGMQPTGLAYSASTDKLYVTNGNGDYVTVIDATTNAVLSTFAWPGRPFGIASSPSGDRVWFTSANNRQLSVIDTSTDAVENTIDLCNLPLLVAFNKSGSRVYVTCSLDSTLAVLDAQSEQVIAITPGFDNPRAIAATTVQPPCSASASISSNFNGTPINAGNSIWFNSNLTAGGAGSSAVTINFTNQSINSGKFVTALPDSSVTFDPAATTATTTFTNGAWTTRIPASGLAGNSFLAGGSLPVPAGGFPGGINPVTWSGLVSTDRPGLAIKWKWGAAVYTAFANDPNQLGVKPVDDNRTSQYHNSDHVGTPENFKGFVTGGARGGGGSNYTGGWSGTADVTPVCPN
jgi:YVTN family beta-propeller protein